MHYEYTLLTGASLYLGEDRVYLDDLSSAIESIDVLDEIEYQIENSNKIVDNMDMLLGIEHCANTMLLASNIDIGFEETLSDINKKTAINTKERLLKASDNVFIRLEAKNRKYSNLVLTTMSKINKTSIATASYLAKESEKLSRYKNTFTKLGKIYSEKSYEGADSGEKKEKITSKALSTIGEIANIELTLEDIAFRLYTSCNIALTSSVALDYIIAGMKSPDIANDIIKVNMLITSTMDIFMRIVLDTESMSNVLGYKYTVGDIKNRYEGIFHNTDKLISELEKESISDYKIMLNSDKTSIGIYNSIYQQMSDTKDKPTKELTAVNSIYEKTAELIKKSKVTITPTGELVINGKSEIVTTCENIHIASSVLSSTFKSTSKLLESRSIRTSKKLEKLSTNLKTIGEGYIGNIKKDFKVGNLGDRYSYADAVILFNSMNTSSDNIVEFYNKVIFNNIEELGSSIDDNLSGISNIGSLIHGGVSTKK